MTVENFFVFPISYDWDVRNIAKISTKMAIFVLILAMFLTSQSYDFDAFAHAGAPLSVA